jgi:xylulokinase
MADQLYLTVDCSTTAAKAVVFDGTGRAVASARSPIAMSRPHPGWHEQHAEQWWDASRAAMAEAVGQLERPERVVAVCFTHQRESFVCLDADDRPLRPAVLWVDTRASREIAELGSRRVAELSGKPPDVTPALYKLAWLRRHEPQVLDAAVRVGDVHAYLARSTGPRSCSSSPGCAARSCRSSSRRASRSGCCSRPSPPSSVSPDRSR